METQTLLKPDEMIYSNRHVQILLTKGEKIPEDKIEIVWAMKRLWVRLMEMIEKHDQELLKEIVETMNLCLDAQDAVLTIESDDPVLSVMTLLRPENLESGMSGRKAQEFWVDMGFWDLDGKDKLKRWTQEQVEAEDMYEKTQIFHQIM